MKIVLDTNFLISMANYHIPVEDVLTCLEEKAEPVILGASVKELEKLIKAGNFSERKSAKLALSIAKSKGIRVISPENGYVDDLILELDPKKHVIATQDIILKRKLKEKGFRLIVIRQKKYAKVE